VVADEKIEAVFLRLKAAEVEITLLNGKTFSKWVDYPKGDYRAPMNESELWTKFQSLADPVVSRSRQQQIGEEIWQLEKLKNIGELMNLLVADKK